MMNGTTGVTSDTGGPNTSSLKGQDDLNVTAGLLRGEPAFTLDWNDISAQVIEIENLSFGDHPCSPEDLRQEFVNPENVVVLLRNSASKQILGYLVASPWADSDYLWVGNVAIHPDFRGRGLVARLMKRFEDGLLDRGKVGFGGNFAITNGFADSVERAYGSKVRSLGEAESPWGPQRCLVVDLKTA